MYWELLAKEVINGKMISMDEAERILNCHDDDLLLILNGAFKIRKYYYGKKVKLNMIMNTKSGLCPENCGYCSQSIVSNAPIEKV